MEKKSPAKPPSITDLAIRHVLNDLIERGQIPVLLTLAKELGFSATNQLRYFLNGERNYPKGKIVQAVKVLKDKYRVNEDYLLTGHGSMYTGKPYMSSESVPTIEEHPNITSIGGVSQYKLLQKQLSELEEKNKALEALLNEKQELIATQRDLIVQLKARAAKTRTKTRTK